MSKGIHGESFDSSMIRQGVKQTQAYEFYDQTLSSGKVYLVMTMHSNRLIHELLRILATIQQGFGLHKICVCWICHTWNWEITPQVFIVIQMMANAAQGVNDVDTTL